MKQVNVFLKNGNMKKVKVQDSVFNYIQKLENQIITNNVKHREELKKVQTRSKNKFNNFSKLVYGEVVNTEKYGKNGKQINFKNKKSIRYNSKNADDFRFW